MENAFRRDAVLNSHHLRRLALDASRLAAAVERKSDRDRLIEAAARFSEMAERFDAEAPRQGPYQFEPFRYPG